MLMRSVWRALTHCLAATAHLPESGASREVQARKVARKGSYGALEKAMRKGKPHHQAIVLKWKRQEAETSGPSGGERMLEPGSTGKGRSVGQRLERLAGW